MSKHIIAEIKRVVQRKARNRRRRATEHLEQARHEPPRPYRRTPRVKPSYIAQGIETAARANRKNRRGHRHVKRPGYGMMSEADMARARQLRRIYRTHLRRMARR